MFKICDNIIFICYGAHNLPNIHPPSPTPKHIPQKTHPKHIPQTHPPSPIPKLIPHARTHARMRDVCARLKRFSRFSISTPPGARAHVGSAMDEMIQESIQYLKKEPEYLGLLCEKKLVQKTRSPFDHIIICM